MIPLTLVQLSDERLRALKDETLARIEFLQSQLGNRDIRGPNGERLSEVDYWAWRANANRERSARLADYRAIKREIAGRNLVPVDTTITDPVKLIYGLVGVAGRLMRAPGYRLTTEDQSCLDSARLWLRTQPRQVPEHVTPQN